MALNLKVVLDVSCYPIITGWSLTGTILSLRYFLINLVESIPFKLGIQKSVKITLYFIPWAWQFFTWVKDSAPSMQKSTCVVQSIPSYLSIAYIVLIQNSSSSTIKILLSLSALTYSSILKTSLRQVCLVSILTISPVLCLKYFFCSPDT